MAIGRRLLEKGVAADLNLIQGAALLHDVVRQKPDHPLEGARVMLREGYPKLADIIIRHHDWERRLEAGDRNLPESMALSQMLRSDRGCEPEAAAVYLADKRLQGTQRVELEERFARSRKRCQGGPDAELALNMHERRYQEAKAVEQMVARWQNRP